MNVCSSPRVQRQMRRGPCPLRSSQSIEHRQQIKYWLCLLGSTFLNSETPFFLCLAAVHIPTQMKWQATRKCALEEPRMGQGTAASYPDEAAFSHWGWVPRRREGGCLIGAVGAKAQLLRSTLRDPSEKQEQSHWHILPSGCVCTDCRMAARLLHQPGPRSRSRGWEAQGRLQNFILFF